MGTSGTVGSYFSKLVFSKFRDAEDTGICAIRGRCSARKLPVIPEGVTIATTGGVFLARVFFTGTGSTGGAGTISKTTFSSTTAFAFLPRCLVLILELRRVPHFRPLVFLGGTKRYCLNRNGLYYKGAKHS